MKNLKIALIVCVVLLCLSTCSRCSNGRKLRAAQNACAVADSEISSRDAKIKDLESHIKVLDEKIYGYEKTMQVQSSAINSITAAKKNITVRVGGRNAK